MKIAYPALFEPQPEGGYTVTFPDLPEAITEGDSVDEARFNAAECLSLVLDVRIEQGDAIPLPSSSEGMVWIKPGAATQAAVLVHLTRESEKVPGGSGPHPGHVLARRQAAGRPAASAQH